jgi:L-threonylcarbamoyladenylate synthase
VERDEASPRASGTLASHYAPDALVRLMSEVEIAQQLSMPGVARPQGEGLAQTAAGAIIGVYSRTAPPAQAGVLHRTMPAHPAQVAHELFAVLRQFDARGVRQIWVQTPPEGAEWEGVRDRLLRAATR